MISEAHSGGGSSSGEPIADTDKLGDVGWETQGGEEPSLTSIYSVWVEQSPAHLALSVEPAVLSGDEL